MFDWRQLLNELRRRNVLRALVAYWVVAWTCIEVSSVIEQALRLPEWLDQMVVILGVAGLPIVVVVSWVFEWGPSGLVPDDGDIRYRRASHHPDDLANQIASEVYRKLAQDMRHARNLRVQWD